MVDTEALKEMIKSKGMKYSFVADKLGISRQNLWAKLNNKSDFSFQEVNELCKILNITSSKTKVDIFLHSV